MKINLHRLPDRCYRAALAYLDTNHPNDFHNLMVSLDFSWNKQWDAKRRAHLEEKARAVIEAGCKAGWKERLKHDWWPGKRGVWL